MGKLQRLSVEYNLTEHCNLSCYACDHASPLLPPRFASLSELRRDLPALAEVFHAQELRLVGGEPLLHPDLLELIREGRRSQVADKIVIMTNGVLLHQMPPQLWQLIDDLRVSVYPGVRRKLSLEACAIICAEHDVYFEADAKNDRFQQSLLNQPIDDPALVQQVFNACEMVRSISCHTVYDGRFYLCPIAPFQPPRLAMLGISFDSRGDSVPLHDNADLAEELEQLLTRQEPLASCRYCLGTAAPWTAHRQMSARDRRLWLQEDHAELIDQVRRRLCGDQERS
jgi:MoaA/NifB/PqqE/SkfB family radical SAM enzyme